MVVEHKIFYDTFIHYLLWLILQKQSKIIVTTIIEFANMLRRDSEQAGVESAQTVIGPSVKVEGELHAVGNVLVEGILNGNLKTDKDTTIGPQAKIIASISTQNAIVAGTVEGNVNVSGHLDIKSTAKITGDIKTKTISIETGAQINGKLSMGSNSSDSVESKKA